MRATANKPEGPCESTASTLGDVLFANSAKRPVSEEAWVADLRAIAAGDQRALQAVYQRAHRIVFTLIMRITHNRETAEELTLDVFHDVWRRAPTYDAAGGPVVGWILNQARSRAIDRLRFEQRKKRVRSGAEDLSTEPVAQASDEINDLQAQADLLRRALRVLTPEERQAIETAFFSEHTYAEVAARLNQPLGTIKTRIRTGLVKLRQALTDEHKAS